MDPIWTLFQRRALTRLMYWLTPLGYNLRDRSLSNRIYLVYFFLFWSVWALAVFSLMGSSAAGILSSLPVAAPLAVVTISKSVLALWGLATLWHVSRRSPFVFGEQDAYLVCQTSASRSKVGLAWFLQGAAGTLVSAGAAAVVLAFALIETQMQGQMTASIASASLGAAARAVFLVLPAVIGWQAALWGLGTLRLHGPVERSWLRPLLLSAGVVVLAGMLLAGPDVLLPFRTAFMAGLPAAERWSGLAVSLLTLAAGLAFLLKQSNRMSLGRAAQETGEAAALSDARRYNQLDLADAILLRRRLGASRAPSRLLSQTGGSILFWKDLLQVQRAFRLRDLAGLALLCGLSAGMFLPAGWLLRMLVAGIWTVNLGALTTRRLRSDLALWWLFRSLPLPAARLMQNELALGWGLGLLASWLGLALSGTRFLPGLYAALLMPLFVAAAAMAVSSDILRQSPVRSVLSPSTGGEDVPRPGFWGFVQALVSVLVPFGILALASGSLWAAAALPAAALIGWLNWSSLRNAYRWVE